MSPTRLRILAYLEKHGPKKATEIARELGLPISTTYNALKEMRLAGLVVYDEKTRKDASTSEGVKLLQKFRIELAAAPASTA